MIRPETYRPRRFLPATLDLGDWTAIEPSYDRLDRMLDAVADAAGMEAWLEAYSELASALAEEGSWRYIAMTLDTDDAAAEKAHLEFLERIDPKVREREFALARRLVELPAFRALNRDRFLVLTRKVETEVALFREENIPLFTDESKLTQKYQKICGAMTAAWDGEERTLTRVAAALEEPDRDRRRRAFDAIARRRARDREELDALFDELRALRGRIASNAGFANYRDYVFRRYERFDYTPEDCAAFADAVERCFVPLLRRVQRDQERSLKVDRLRPWDLAVDPRNRPPLKPFAACAELATGAQRIFDGLDPDLARDFALLRERGLLDLDNRKAKAPGGYQSTLQEARLPFIFMNAVGLHRDVETLLHESGHAFHALAARDLFPSAYRHAPIEFCEVASMGMELLAQDRLGVFYNEEDHRRARLDHIKGIISVFPWIAQVDTFQHWIYLNKEHSREGRTRAWLELTDRFGGIADWTDYEFARVSAWHRQLHIFEMPFYYIEYGIAQIGALGLWVASRRDFAGTLARYRRALALGGSRPLPELFAAAGLEFDFSERSLAPLAEELEAEYERLSA